MNILEILDTNVRDEKSKHAFKDRFLEPSPTSKQGAYGRAHGIQDPHQIMKKPHYPQKTQFDGYLNYIKYVVDNKIAESNPFAPRVYDSKTITDASDNVKYSVKMERLTPIDSFDNEVVYQIGKRLYGEYFYSYVRKNKVQDEGIPVPELTHTLRALSYIIRDNCEGKVSSKNKKLNQLCSAIKQLANDTHSRLDIHSGNLMIRMSPHPQLVIVDPLV